jgi:hypothetical protein
MHFALATNDFCWPARSLAAGRRLPAAGWRMSAGRTGTRAGPHAPSLDASVEQWLQRVDAHLATLARLVDAHNRAVDARVREILEQQRETVIAERAQLAASKYAVVERADAPAPFTIPPITSSRVQQPLPRRSERLSPFSDPQLQELFTRILNTVRAATSAMQRSPANYRDWQEEQLRDVVLLALNMVYQSHARAEAFNAAGHTDLLIAVDGQNLFIGECKIWHGSKSFGQALEQLMSYSTWQDGRLALIFFVREENIVDITAKGRQALQDRDELVRWIDRDGDGPIARIRWPNDPGREATLAIVFCHLPRSA